MNVAFVQLEKHDGVFIATCGNNSHGSTASPLHAARTVAACHLEVPLGEIALTLLPDNKVYAVTMTEFLKGTAP